MVTFNSIISDVGSPISVIFLFIIILIAIIIQCKLTFGVSFIMNKMDVAVFITIYFFRDRLKKHIDVYPRKKRNSNKIKKKKKKSIKKKNNLKKLIKRSRDVLDILKVLKKGLQIKDFRFYLKEGTGNAFNTAMLYGLTWNFIGIFQSFLLKHFIVKNNDIRIEQDFNEKVWKINFNCIFSVKIVNIILTCIKLLIYYLKIRKGGEADVRPSNRRSNDYSNAKY